MCANKKEFKRTRNQYSFSGDYSAADISLNNMWDVLKYGVFPLYPFAVEETIRQNQVRFQEDHCRFMIVTILLEGKLLYQYAGRNYLLEPGMVIVIPPGSSYSFDSSSTGGYRKLVIEFSGINIESICSTLNFNQFIMHSFPDISGIISRILEIKDMLTARNDADIPEILGKSYQFLIMLAGQIYGKQKKSLLLSKAQQRLESLLDLPLSTKELAEELGVSCTHLNRIFREKLHISPQKYRNTCKIESARELLLHSNMSIKEISDKIGYCNQFHFSRQFLRHTGKTPSGFRSERQFPGD